MTATLSFDEVTAAIALVDEGGAILGATRAARELLSALGVADHGAAESPTVLPQRWRDELACAAGPVVWSASRPPLGLLRVGCTGYPLSGARTLLLMRDIGSTERALARLLRRQREEAAGRLAASIAHDLRAPLASMTLDASALHGAASRDPAAIPALLAGFDECLRRIQRDIDRLLDWARIGPPVRERVGVRQAVTSARQLVGKRLGDGAHQLVVAVAPDAAEVVANRIALEHILVELVQNAIDAAAGAPARITLSARRARADRVDIAVHDEGTGVDPSIASLVFEPFFTTRHERAGVGLSIARETARELGGDLALSPSERGALFVLAVPTSHETGVSG